MKYICYILRKKYFLYIYQLLQLTYLFFLLTDNHKQAKTLPNPLRCPSVLVRKDFDCSLTMLRARAFLIA